MDTITGTTPKGVGYVATPLDVRILVGAVTHSDPDGTGVVRYAVVTDDGQDFECAHNIKSLARMGKDLKSSIEFIVDQLPTPGFWKDKFETCLMPIPNPIPVPWCGPRQSPCKKGCTTRIAPAKIKA